MSAEKLKTTDLLPEYKEKYFIEAKQVIAEIRRCTHEYTQMDNLYDLEGLETIKRELVGYLELLASHAARVKKYKTMGDYLEELRKRLKAETVEYIVGDSTKKLSTNQAEKVVYAHPRYIARMEVLSALKGFFNIVEFQYDRGVDTLSNIRQSISVCRKDPNFKPVEDEI